MAERKKLGELLIDGGLIDQYQLKSALAHQRQWGGRVGAVVVKLGFVTEQDLVDFLSRSFSIPSVNLHGVKIPVQLIQAVPKDVAKKYGIVPLKYIKEKKHLFVGMSDPNNLMALDELSFLVNARVQPVIASDTAIEQALAHYYDKTMRMELEPDAVLSTERDYTQIAQEKERRIKEQTVSGKIDLSDSAGDGDEDDDEVVVGDAEEDEPLPDFSALSDDEDMLDDVLVFTSGAEKSISISDGTQRESAPRPELKFAKSEEHAKSLTTEPEQQSKKEGGAPSSDQLIMALVRVLIDKGLLTKEELLARLK